MAKLIEKTVVMDGKAIERALTRIAHEIIEKNKGTKDVIIVGIRKRGVPLAERLSSIIENIEGVHIPIGVLDITLYRDDLAHMSYQPLIQETHIDEDITNKTSTPPVRAAAARPSARPILWTLSCVLPGIICGIPIRKTILLHSVKKLLITGLRSISTSGVSSMRSCICCIHVSL